MSKITTIRRYRAAEAGPMAAAALGLDKAGNVISAGRLIEKRTIVNVDAQNNTLSAAQIAAGIVIHTSVSAGGTVTTGTAAEIIAGSAGVGALNFVGATIDVHYINDGNQVLTLAAGDGSVTIVDTGQTIGENESAVIRFVRTGSTTVSVYVMGA